MAAADGPLLDPADALAALRDRGRAGSRADAPWRRRLDAGYTVELPAPRVLARVFAAPTLAAGHDLFASGSAILRRRAGETRDPCPEAFDVLADELRAALEVLPVRPDAGRPYTDLQKYLLDGDPGEVAGYLCDAIRAVRVAAPRWRPRIERRERPAQRSAAERQRASRAGRRGAETESSRVWLATWREETEPGTRVAAPALYDRAAADIGEWVETYRDDPAGWAECEAEDGFPAVPAVPGPRTFYAVADDALGGRQRGTGNARVYTVPATAAELIDRVQSMSDREGLRAA
ncbi:hypothetical protein [Micromonospora sp. WMMD737]|uniref:hypothetical protein n=1 Tax=Micromonospora sp. WMMD737 TaxID=3404113 RepID=UPI003B95CE86